MASGHANRANRPNTWLGTRVGPIASTKLHARALVYFWIRLSTFYASHFIREIARPDARLPTGHGTFPR
jgi:hypothetical protein